MGYRDDELSRIRAALEWVGCLDENQLQAMQEARASGMLALQMIGPPDYQSLRDDLLSMCAFAIQHEDIHLLRRLLENDAAALERWHTWLEDVAPAPN